MDCLALIRQSNREQYFVDETGGLVKKGIYLAIIAAVISGISVFVASFASKAIKDPYLLTTGRNIVVAVWLSAVLIGASKWVSLKKLTLKQWLQIVLIGIIGGSIPFLLFFKGLSLSTASGGQLINKTMFIWVGLFAVVFLKEKLNKWQLFALAILLVGNYFLATPKSWVFGQGELLVLIATLFWAMEAIIAKIALKNMPSIVLAWGRMFFGSLIMLAYLAFTDKIGLYQSLNPNQLLWIVLPSLLLFAYVWLWFSSLKYAPATLVTSILVIASPITTLLSSIFITHKYQLNQVVASLLIITGVLLIITLSKNKIHERRICIIG